MLLSLIQQLLKGAHEGEEKKRKIRLSNAQIKRRLVDVKGTVYN